MSENSEPQIYSFVAEPKSVWGIFTQDGSTLRLRLVGWASVDLDGRLGYPTSVIPMFMQGTYVESTVSLADWGVELNEILWPDE